MTTKNTQNKEKGNFDNSEKETDSNPTDLVKTFLLGVGITNENWKNILEYIVKNLQKDTKPYYIVTPNPEILVRAHHHSDFKAILNNAKIALLDGVGITVAARVLSRPLTRRFNGVDFVEKLCEKVANRPITVGFLGAGDVVAEKTAECLGEKYPGLKISFANQEWDEDGFVFREKDKGLMIKDKDTVEEKKKIYHSSFISHHSIDILFVAFGAPKQEEWMASHVRKIPVKVMVGVGGAFDQIVHPSLRPPKVIQDIGLGWFYRLIRQPWRMKRQLALIEFMWLVFKEGLSGKSFA